MREENKLGKIWPLNSEAHRIIQVMEGLEPYACIHFTRTHGLSIAIFQTCPYCVCFSFHFLLMLFSTQDLLHFIWG